MLKKLKDKTQDTLFLSSGIFISGNKEVSIENCRKIEEFNDIFVQLISGELRVKIWGSKLRSYDFNDGGIIIRGIISHLEFSERIDKRNEKTNKKLCNNSGKR